MKERLHFLRDHASGHFSFTELCRQYGVSRKTGYKWLDRFQAEGVGGLLDRSRRPHSSPNQIDTEQAEILLEMKRRHPKLGPKKIKGILELDQPSTKWPAASTIGELFKRNGLVKTRRRHRKPGHPGFQSATRSKPNEIWTAGFKGEFRTLDGVYCYPLTIVDSFSRFILAVDALAGTRHASCFRACLQRIWSS